MATDEPGPAPKTHPRTPKLASQKPPPRSTESLLKPFKCPGAALTPRTSSKPTRKRRKVDYGGADAASTDHDKSWVEGERQALADRHINQYPVFEVKDKETTFKRRFAVPLINKDSAAYNPSRSMPALGMRTGATFIAKPLHDPSGEFAIVLYDPTIDDKPAEEEALKDGAPEEKPKLDVPLMHRSLADILGLKKKVEQRPKVPVVIDPRLAKVLRPHQVEGVKVSRAGDSSGLGSLLMYACRSFFTAVLRACSIERRMAASWPTRWAWERRYVCRPRRNWQIV